MNPCETTDFMTLSGWGNYPRIPSKLMMVQNMKEAAEVLREPGCLIPRGMGRSYNDSALAPRTLGTLKANRILSLDRRKGIIRCQCGVTFEDLLAVLVPLGWFLPVTPGTKYVTVGGAVAADVHGKNHHGAGCFSEHVLEMELLDSDGKLTRVSPTVRPELFRMTCGGMGLTGFIATVTFKLIPIETPSILQETEKASDLQHSMDLFEASSKWDYLVAWIDCLASGTSLGRSVLIRGKHATLDSIPKGCTGLADWRPPSVRWSLPMYPPVNVLNRATVGLFNKTYYASFKRDAHQSIVDLDPFFYPLDKILHWNRMYGRQGFVQYQVMFPKRESKNGLERILGIASTHGSGSFLAVLKLMGKARGGISFPMEGYTLALDFPATPSVFGMFKKLDQVTLEHGGRLYLAKDARMGPGMLRAGYPSLDRFLAVKNRWNRRGKFRSLLSERLEI